MASPKQKRTPLARSDRPDYDYLDGLTLAIYPCSNPEPAPREVVVTTPTGKRAVFTVERKDGECVIRSFDVVSWQVSVVGGDSASTTAGEVKVRL